MTCFKEIKKLYRDTAATILVAFAVMAPIIVASTGMALDFAQAYLVRERLSHALDAAAIAAAVSNLEGEALQQHVQNFLDANYPPDRIGFSYELVVTVEGDTVHVSAYADYITFFLNVIGIEDLTVFAESEVVREVRPLEVVLVLDNTGSMSTNNNIGTLKTATEDFIDILYNSTDNPDYIKVGLVPYANAVRVGRYGLGQNPDGTQYADGETFVTLPAGYTYTTSHNHTSSTQWYGCVIEYNEDGWDPAITTNDPYPHDVLDDYEGPWDIYRYETYGGTPAQYRVYTRPAQNCPYANIVPLTNDRELLQDTIDSMTAHGMTLGNIGMVWGYRVISPEFPFEEGVDWDNTVWRKAVIMMTDGDNTRDSHYSAFWRKRQNQLTVTDYNQRFAETCEAMKEQGVLIYTITFYSGISEATKDYYRDCATDETYYHDAPDQEELLQVFHQIGRELANLHITQ